MTAIAIDLSQMITAEARAAARASAAETAIQRHIDGVAASRGYRDGFALAGYATSTVPAWAAEAAAFVAWRDAVWGYAYTQLAAVQTGEREQPTVTELVAELPQMEWPA